MYTSKWLHFSLQLNTFRAIFKPCSPLFMDLQLLWFGSFFNVRVTIKATQGKIKGWARLTNHPVHNIITQYPGRDSEFHKNVEYYLWQRISLPHPRENSPIPQECRIILNDGKRRPYRYTRIIWTQLSSRTEGPLVDCQ